MKRAEVPLSPVFVYIFMDRERLRFFKIIIVIRAFEPIATFLLNSNK